MKGIVLAAGLGTRLRPLTDNCPKALLPVDGRPMLAHAIDSLIDAGSDTIVVNAYHHADMICEFTDNYKNLCQAELIVSDERPTLLNTGGGITTAISRFPESDDDEQILVINADILTDFPLKAISEANNNDHADITLLVNPSRVTTRRLIIDNVSKRMLGWYNSEKEICRTPLDTTISELLSDRCILAAFGGIHLLRYRVLNSLKGYSKENPTFSIMDFYIEKCNHLTIKGFMPDFSYTWTDIGKPEIYNKLKH